MDVEWLATLGEPFPPFGQQVESGTQHDGASDDAVHVEGFKPEHLVNAEPADHLPHGEGDAEENAEEEKRTMSENRQPVGEHKMGDRESPMKKPMAAIRLGHWRN